MKRLALALAMIVTILAPINAAIPPKAGALCSKQGITKDYKGKTYRCIKSGKKIVWSKGTKTKSTSEASAPTHHQPHHQLLPALALQEILKM